SHTPPSNTDVGAPYFSTSASLTPAIVGALSSAYASRRVAATTRSSPGTPIVVTYQRAVPPGMPGERRLVPRAIAESCISARISCDVLLILSSANTASNPCLTAWPQVLTSNLRLRFSVTTRSSWVQSTTFTASSQVMPGRTPTTSCAPSPGRGAVLTFAGHSTLPRASAATSAAVAATRERSGCAAAFDRSGCAAAPDGDEAPSAPAGASGEPQAASAALM